MHTKVFEPKIVTVFREGYSLHQLCNDVLAGIVVGIVALPLSIALAIASGVKPEQGLVTAFIAGFLISLLSGSRVQIGGPTGAFIVIVFGIVQQHGYEGLAVATFMAGILLVLMGALRLGDVIKYIPYPVTVGFTSGIALVIFATQIRDFLGLNMPSVPSHFIDKWFAYFQSMQSINFWALGLSILTICIIYFWPRVTKRVPGTMIAIIVTTILVQWLQLPVETIFSRFGHMPHHIPFPRLPHLDLATMAKLGSCALTIALLAGIESLLSAVVADGMLGTRHRSNMELISQGVANIISPLFGGIPATGAIARTATNIKNGGRTPVAGMVHALVILALFLFCAKWAGLIPLATLSGILVVVAYNMSEWRHFRSLLKSSRGDILVLLLTFFLTVLVDLTVAIEVGVVLAAFLFMHRMAEMTNVHLVDDAAGDDRLREYTGVPEGIEIFEINGPFFFGAADKFRDAIASFKKNPQVIILRMSAVPTVDATAVSALVRFVESCQRGKIHVVFAGVNKRVFKILHKSDVVSRIGMENILADVPLALARSIEIIENSLAANTARP